MKHEPPVDFAPAMLRARSDGWTPPRQRLFIEALAAWGSVRLACEHVSLSAASAYKMRAHPEARAFRAAWDAALASASARLIDLALERCREGTTQPVFHKGEVIGSRQIYSEKLMMFMINRLESRDARLADFAMVGKADAPTYDDVLGRALAQLDAQIAVDDAKAAATAQTSSTSGVAAVENA